MRRIALLALAMSALFSGSALASGHHHTKVVGDCVHARYKPMSITLACGDGNLALTKIAYMKWTKRVAKGTDRTFQNSCDPDCADGSPVYTHDHFTLDRPKTNKGATVFTRARIYHKGKLVTTYPLGYPR